MSKFDDSPLGEFARHISSKKIEKDVFNKFYALCDEYGIKEGSKYYDIIRDILFDRVSYVRLRFLMSDIDIHRDNLDVLVAAYSELLKRLPNRIKRACNRALDDEGDSDQQIGENVKDLTDSFGQFLRSDEIINESVILSNLESRKNDSRDIARQPNLTDEIISEYAFGDDILTYISRTKSSVEENAKYKALRSRIDYELSSTIDPDLGRLRMAGSYDERDRFSSSLRNKIETYLEEAFAKRLDSDVRQILENMIYIDTEPEISVDADEVDGVRQKIRKFLVEEYSETLDYVDEIIEGSKELMS